MDVEEYNNIQEAKEAQTRERKELQKDCIKIDESAKWRCFTCDDEYLRLVIYGKVHEPYYFRRCPNCGNRTKGKKFSSNVKGLMPDDEV